MKTILHVIPRLVQGGAEQLLLDLVASSNTNDHRVITLLSSNSSELSRRVEGRLTTVQAKSYMGIACNLRQLRRTVRGLSPDLVVTWMYHASLCGPVFTPRNVPILAYMHNTNLAAAAKWQERSAQRGFAHISRSSRVHLLYTGLEARSFHEDEQGYVAARAGVMTNGISLAAYTPDTGRRVRTRLELGLPRDATVAGAFGRYNPQKNWPLMLDAIRQASILNPRLYMIAAGRGATMANAEFAELVSSRGLEDRVLALGAQDKMPRLYDAIDFLMLGSEYGEAFPLVVLEALAMGKPVVATNLGSVPSILDGLIRPVPVGSRDAFVQATCDMAIGQWDGLLRDPSEFRVAVEAKYSLDGYVRAFDELAAQIIEGGV